MERTKRARPSPSMLVALLALFVALTGVAWAAGLAKNSVKSKQIKDGQVRNADLAANAVDSAKTRDESLGGADVGGLTGADIDGLTGADVVDGSLDGADVDGLTGADVGGLTGADVEDESMTGADVGGLTGADVTDGSLGGPDVDESTLQGVNADQLDGLDANSLNRVASGSTTDSALVGNGNILPSAVSITVPRPGFLLIIASADALRVAAGGETFQCQLALDGNQLAASQRLIEINDTTNQEENCATNAVAAVATGVHTVQVQAALSAANIGWGPAEVDVLFVPFNGVGA